MKKYKFKTELLKLIPDDQNFLLAWRMNPGTYWSWNKSQLRRLTKPLKDDVHSLCLTPFPSLIEALYDLEET